MPWIPGEPPWTPQTYLLAYVASRRFTHVQLAEALGVTRQSIHRWLKGETRLTYGHLYQWRMVTRALERTMTVGYRNFPEFYVKLRRNQYAGRVDNGIRVARNANHPGGHGPIEVATLFAGKPDITIELHNTAGEE